MCARSRERGRFLHHINTFLFHTVLMREEIVCQREREEGDSHKWQTDLPECLRRKESEWDAPAHMTVYFETNPLRTNIYTLDLRFQGCPGKNQNGNWCGSYSLRLVFPRVIFCSFHFWTSVIQVIYRSQIHPQSLVQSSPGHTHTHTH